MIFICLCSVTMKVTFWEHFTLFMFVCAHFMNIYPFFVNALGLTQMNLRLCVSRHIEFDKESLIFKFHIQYTPTNTLRLIITLFNTSHIITLKLYKVLKLCFTQVNPSKTYFAKIAILFLKSMCNVLKLCFTQLHLNTIKGVFANHSASLKRLKLIVEVNLKVGSDKIKCL